MIMKYNYIKSTKNNSRCILAIITHIFLKFILEEVYARVINDMMRIT